MARMERLRHNRAMPTLILALIAVYAVFFWLIHALAVRKP